MEEIVGALAPEEKSNWLPPGSRNGDVHSHCRGLALIPNFFSLRNTQLALPHCFVLFLEVAEAAFRQFGTEKETHSLSRTCQRLKGFSFLKDCEGPSDST